MDERKWLAERFEEKRPRLRAVAYRMLGSLSEAEDAVQEAWLRLSGTAYGEVDDLGAWLTTVVARISLNMLRSRKTRSESHVPEPIVDRADGTSPEHGALLANTVGLALLVVLETLAPAERIAFVLHDIFGMPFEEVAPIVERTPDAARQLASRARRRVQARNATPDADVQVQRSVVDAFVAAARDGDFHKLVAVLDPDVVLRGDGGPLRSSGSGELRGAEQVARSALTFSRLDLLRLPVLVNGAAGLVCMFDGKPFSVTEPLHYRYADPSRDEFVRPVVVEPPVSVVLPSQNFVVAIGSVREVSVLVRAMVAGQTGELTFEAPHGWSVFPAKAAFDLKEAGATQEIRFRLTPPVTPGAGNFKVIASLHEGLQIASTVNVIDYAHVPAQTIFEVSGGSMAAVHLRVLAKRVGYVMGSEDKMPEAIRQMGCRVDLLDAKTLSTGDLSVYDAIVTGLRAYAVRADLREAQKRLLRYVSNGGTLVVQYNRLDDRRISPAVAEAFDHMGPYPFALSQGNTERVTEEDAPVKILTPASPIMHFPNTIATSDFAGWVQERGVYFADSWDAHYQTPFETHDAGDKDLKGSLLYARYGKGAYVYTSFSWFREMPAGVPGAFRIFANLLSAGKAAAQ